MVNGLSECTGGRIINAATGNGVLWNDCSAGEERLGGIIRHLQGLAKRQTLSSVNAAGK